MLKRASARLKVKTNLRHSTGAGQNSAPQAGGNCNLLLAARHDGCSLRQSRPGVPGVRGEEISS